MRIFNENEVREMLEDAVIVAGSQNRLASKIGCSPPYLSDVRHGNRGFGPMILDFLGLECNVETKKTYRKKKE